MGGLIAAWQRLAQKPQRARELNICAFLDKVKTETEAGVNIGRTETRE